MNSEQLIIYITQVIEEIFQTVLSSKDLLEDKNKMALIEAILKALDQLGVVIEEVIPKEILTTYYSAVDEASALLEEAGVPPTGGLALTAVGQVAKGFQTKIHLEAVQTLVEDTLLDLQAAIRTAKASARANIEQALSDVKADIAKGLIVGDPSKVVSKRVAQSFLKNGLTSFVTSDGKSLPLDYYSRLVTRTKMREAGTQSHSNRYLENGQGLVKINERADTCHVCAKYRDMIVSLTGEHEGFPSNIPLPPYHPHCRGDISVWVIDFKSDEEIEEEKKKWRDWKEDVDSRSPAQKREFEKSQEIRRKANEEKKMFMRYQSVLGAEMPTTLGGFRRMKRSNSPRFQELQSMYRSAVHSKD
ncbi:phage minor capsid protein [Metabacillus litoralis]|uniref:phage minor capsid protein n=1 Tax=Metabacillus litoralis TaxID=152268 RepID=UPI0020410EE0|nr:phage minor capsid protein [Metabacillus litoralis]MCM3651322.1 hypothetical protein [Metabacillus litoralis]